MGNQREARNRSNIRIGNNIKNAENMRLVIDIDFYVWKKSYLKLLIIILIICAIQRPEILSTCMQ